jgi:hypothetical protein
MSRIIYPSSLEQILALVKNVKAKHDSDSPDSVLTPLLTQKNIDLAADIAACTVAIAHKQSGLLFSQQSENYIELRNLKLEPVLTHTKTCFQYLKSFYKPNYKALADWGAPIDTNGKITYPADINERTSIFKLLFQKHNSFPSGESPLLPYLMQNDIDLLGDNTAVDNALAFHAQYEHASKAAENETEQRDIICKPITDHLHSIGDFLKKLYNDNTKTLGMWGFVVDSSPRAPKLRTSIIKPREKSIMVGLVLGSTLTNIGKTDLHIYAGRNTNGNPAIVHAGDSLGITKGFSVITVANPSTTEKVILTVLIKP